MFSKIFYYKILTSINQNFSKIKDNLTGSLSNARNIYIEKNHLISRQNNLETPQNVAFIKLEDKNRKWSNSNNEFMPFKKIIDKKVNNELLYDIKKKEIISEKNLLRLSKIIQQISQDILINLENKKQYAPSLLTIFKENLHIHILEETQTSPFILNTLNITQEDTAIEKKSNRLPMIIYKKI